MFELSDPSGNPAGHIEVMLRWKSSYLPPSYLINTTRGLTGSRNEGEDQSKEELHSQRDEGTDETQEEEWAKGDPVNVSTPQPDEAAAQVITGSNSATLRSRLRPSGDRLNPFTCLHLAVFSHSGSSAYTQTEDTP